MSFELRWVVPERVFTVELIDDVTSDEFLECSAQVIDWIQQGTPPVHYINDMRRLKSMPTNLAFLRKATRTLKSENLGWVIVWGDINPMFNFAGSIITQINGVNMRIFSEAEEIETFLKKMDPTLNDDFLGLKV